jgi:ribosomal protein S18 acetylase RimI-like enzyme
MLNVMYTEANRNDLDLIAPLWQKLKEHHKALAPGVFSGHFDKMDFVIRKKQLLDKSRNGDILVDLARDVNSDMLIGYCVSTVTGAGTGEIDSIYVEENYRRHGIGKKLMTRALKWLDAHALTKRIIEVAGGNEAVFPFYRQYGFYPRTIVLEQVESTNTENYD